MPIVKDAIMDFLSQVGWLSVTVKKVKNNHWVFVITTEELEDA